MTEQERPAAGVFDGLKVLDIASFIAGPAAGVILADFGASVIKVEAPGGDPHRNLDKLPGMPQSEIAYQELVDFRHKRSIVLDLTHPDGRAVLDRLATDADVIISNHRPQLRAKLRTNYADFKAINPKVIFASITGYGEAGAEADKAGFDSSALWARTGLMDLVKADPEAEPARSVPGMGDHPTAVSLYAAIVTGLLLRERTGKGMHVSTSLVANGLWSNAFYAQAGLLGVEIPRRPRRAEVKNALSNHYRCRDDRWFILSMVQEDREWSRFCDAMGRPDWCDDPRFAERAERHRNAVALAGEIDAMAAEHDWDYWREKLEAARITFGPVAKVEDLADDRQLRDGGALVPMTEGAPKGTWTIDSPFWLTGVAKRPATAGSSLGADGDAILRELGYQDSEIAALRGAGALG